MFSALIDAAIDRWRSTFFIMFLLFLFGITSYIKIPKEQNPEVKLPFINVYISYEGVSPEDGERMILKPLERQLKIISGVKELKCTAQLGSASCSVEFRPEIDSEKALREVKDKTDIAKSEFPTDAKEPTVTEIDFSKFPVLSVAIMGDVTDDILFGIADKLKNKITEIKEVLEVTIYGNREHSVEIIVKPEVVNQYGINLNDLLAIARNNNIVIGGTLRTQDGAFPLKIPGLVEKVTDLLEMPVKAQGGTVLRFKDIATVKKTYKDPTSLSRRNGVSKSVLINVSKRSGENIIATIEKVMNVVDEQVRYFPKDIEISYSGDSSASIKEALSSLNNNLAFSVMIVFLVVLNMIGLRQSLFVVVTIPLTFLMGITFLYFGGFTMNTIVLFALILGTGMIVDASIVVIEYSEMMLEDGVPHKEAYRKAAKKMLIPVFASVVTVLIAAGPLMFWPGVVGGFMKYLPLTLIALLSSSFITAILFLPVIGTVFGKTHEGHAAGSNADILSYSNLIKTDISVLLQLKGRIGWYIKMVERVLDNPKKTLLILLGTIVTIVTLYVMFNKGSEFFPDVEGETARLVIRTRGNLSVEAKDELLKKAEAVIKKETEILQFISYTGSEDRVAVINISDFKHWQDRRKIAVIMEDLRNKIIEAVPGVVVNVDGGKGGASAEKSIMFNVLSEESTNLDIAADKILEYMKGNPTFMNVDDSRPFPKIEYALKIDRAEASKYGIDITTIGSFVRLATDGTIVSNYRPTYSDDKVDILLRFPEGHRNINEVKNIRVPAASGKLIPISTFATVETQKDPGKITRIDQKRAVSISANHNTSMAVSHAMKELTDWLKANMKDPAVEVKMAGDAESQAETGAFLANAFSIALTIMLLLFLVQFNSFGKTVIVLNSIFLGIFGVLLGLTISGQPFSVVMCGLAVVALSGMVVDSNILFIDTFNTLQEEGLSTKEALLKTAILRVKPILLASITTVAGLMPMVFALSINFTDREITIGSPASQWWVQLSVSIAGGLSFVTCLTLFFTPAILLLEERFKQKLKNGELFKRKQKIKGFTPSV